MAYQGDHVLCVASIQDGEVVVQPELLRPFSLCNSSMFVALLERAGFREVDACHVVRIGSLASIDEYFIPYEKGGGRLGQFYLGLSDDSRNRAKDRVHKLLAQMSHEGVVTMRIEAIMVSGFA